MGAPSGALGGSNGAQSGVESRMSTFTTPLNGLLMAVPPEVAPVGTPPPVATGRGGALSSRSTLPARQLRYGVGGARSLLPRYTRAFAPNRQDSPAGGKSAVPTLAVRRGEERQRSRCGLPSRAVAQPD